MSRWLRGKRSEETKPTKIKPTGPVYHITSGGISLVGENLYEKIRKEIIEIGKEESKDKEEKTEKRDPIREAKNKLGLPSTIDFIGLNPENPFLYVEAFSPEDTKKVIKEYQSRLERGFGIKIDLEKLEARKL